MNFSFTPKTTGGITFGSPATPTPSLAPATGTGLTFGASPANATTGFALGMGAGDNKLNSAQTASVKPIAAVSASGFSLTPASSTTAVPTAATTGFPSFGLTAATTTATAPAQASTTGFSFGATSTPSLSATTTSAPISFSLAPATTAAATGLKLGLTTTTPATISLAAPAPAITSASITFVQLEEQINKWTMELDEQEKLFTSQAEQINNWDNLLNSNSEKIVSLNSDVATMKLQQQQLAHELDFVVAQQRELEEVLAPLERQASEAPSNTDPEREHIYHMAESLDTQLKQMSEDLREIIENINESSRTQDSSDPVVQIGRVLNAHMNSLNWIDQMTLNIQNQLENVTKVHDILRRENERSFRITYE